MRNAPRGASLIEYLEPNRYVGLDIDQKILDVGREMLPPGMFDAKRPRLAVITPQSLSEVAPLRPKWVFSKGVLQHVPPSELGEFFQSLAAVMHPETVGMLRAQIGSKNEQISAKSWLHTVEDLQRTDSTSRSMSKSRSAIGFPCECTEPSRPDAGFAIAALLG